MKAFVYTLSVPLKSIKLIIRFEVMHLIRRRCFTGHWPDTDTCAYHVITVVYINSDSRSSLMDNIDPFSGVF
jgi:hypothetical protein